MMLLLLVASITLASAARLDHLLPRSSDAISVDAAVTPRNRHYAAIVRMSNEPTGDGYQYSYEGSDGSKADQHARIIPGATEDTGSIQVQGSYSYIGTDGQTYSITYTADENGFRPIGSHLPTPPPVPEAIARANSGQYASVRSSYDADNTGYKY